MKNKLIIFAAATALGCSFSKLSAEDKIPPPPPEKPATSGSATSPGTTVASPGTTVRGRHTPEEMFKHLDSNGDGKISKEEFLKNGRKGSEERFKKIDTNGDGFIDKQEFEAAMKKLHEMIGKKRGDKGSATGPRKKPDASNTTANSN